MTGKAYVVYDFNGGALDVVAVYADESAARERCDEDRSLCLAECDDKDEGGQGAPPT